MTRSTYNSTFDGLRCVAVLGVMAHHIYGLFRGGFLGVDLFFVLSGFLITSLLLSEIGLTGTIKLRNFYIRRALRLLPALLVAIILAGIFWPLSDPTHPVTWIEAASAALFYYSNFLVSGRSLSHCWSLSVEEHFYFFWPALLRLLSKRSTTGLIAVTVVLILSVAVLRAYLFYNFRYSFNLYTCTFTRIDTILIGALTAVLLAKSPRFNQLVDSLAQKWKGTEVCVCFILVSFMFASVEPVPYLFLGGFDFIAVIMALFIAIMSQPKYNQGRLGAILSSAPLVWIGKRSYALYLYDPIVNMTLENFRVRHSIPNLIAVVTLRFCITFLLAALSFRFIEQPALKLKSRFY